MIDGLTSISRRRILGGLAAGTTAFLSGGMPVIAQSPTKFLIMEPFDLALEYMHELNGVVGGHFAKEGLDVTVSNTRGTAVAIQQVVAGQARTSRVGVLDLVKAAAAQDTPVISIGTSNQEAIFTLISLKSAPIKSAADMRGKTIGVASMGGGTENTLNLMLASGGVPIADVPRQAIGSNASNIEILKAGRVAGFFATVANTILLQRAGEPIETWGASEAAPMPGGIMLATKTFAEQNPDAVIKFLRAMRNSAFEIINSDPGMILDRITAKYDLDANPDRAFRIETIKVYNQMTLAQGKENVMRNVPAVWEKAADLINKANIAKVPDITALYTNRYIDEAAK